MKIMLSMAEFGLDGPRTDRYHACCADEPVDGSDSGCRNALLGATCLEDMEQLLSLHELPEAEQSGTPKTCSMNKVSLHI